MPQTNLKQRRDKILNPNHNPKPLNNRTKHEQILRPQRNNNIGATIQLNLNNNIDNHHATTQPTTYNKPVPLNKPQRTPNPNHNILTNHIQRLNIVHHKTNNPTFQLQPNNII